MFLDLRKAYDSVDRKLLFEILLNRARNNPLKLKLVELMFQLYHKNMMVYDQSISIKANKGVPQGSSVSPSLFNLYLEDAIMSNNLLSAAARNGKLRAFADDLLIVADDIEELQKFITAIDGWQQSHKLILNKEKSAIMTNNYKYKNLIEIDGIPAVRKFKYLGVHSGLSTSEIRK
jgi:hypothetical protein